MVKCGDTLKYSLDPIREESDSGHQQRKLSRRSNFEITAARVQSIQARKPQGTNIYSEWKRRERMSEIAPF